MSTRRVVVGIAIVLGMLTDVYSLAALASENDTAAISNAGSANLIERLDRLENRLTDLEVQVIILKREKMEVEESLKHQREADAALRSQMMSQTASTVVRPSQNDPDPREDRVRHDLVYAWGCAQDIKDSHSGRRKAASFMAYSSIICLFNRTRVCRAAIWT